MKEKKKMLSLEWDEESEKTTCCVSRASGKICQFVDELNLTELGECYDKVAGECERMKGLLLKRLEAMSDKVKGGAE